MFDLSCAVNGTGLRRSIFEIEAMNADHVLRDRERLIDLFERIESASKG